VEIDGIGEGIITGLCEQGLVKDLSDLYYLTPEKVTLVTGGKRSGEKAITAILEKNQIPLAVFLDSLGIDGLGTTTSKDIAKRFKTLDAVLTMSDIARTLPRSAMVELRQVGGIGELTANKIIAGLQQMRPTIERLVQCIDVLDVETISGGLSGKSFLITGTLSKERKEIEKMIVSAGGEIKSSVSMKLDYLIVGNDPGSKVDKADKLGISKISETDLMEMIG
jgi:DNA ligase (NAD+)